MFGAGEGLHYSKAFVGPVENSTDATSPTLSYPALSRTIAVTANGVDSHNDGHLEPPATSALILLVECDLASLLICANELLDEGYEVIESESTVIAMTMLLHRNDFDVMIVDIDRDHAPGGLALVRYAARHLPKIKILIHSAWIDAQAESDVIGAGFLPKPYPAGALVRQMLSLLTPRPRQANEFCDTPRRSHHFEAIANNSSPVSRNVSQMPFSISDNLSRKSR